jgi:hypothetical protein
MGRRVIYLSLDELQTATKSSRCILSSRTDLRPFIPMNWQREIGRTYSKTRIGCFVASPFGIASTVAKSIHHSFIQLEERDFD